MRKPFFRRRKSDPFSGENAPKIDYRDVRLLQRYVSERGKIIPKRVASVWFQRSDEQQHAARVIMPPGGTALKVLKFVFTKRAFESVFAQTIADMREEHAEALHNKEFHKARWIVVRDHFGIILTVIFYVATAIGKKLLGIWKMIP